jgi:hypothetical protein
MRHLVSTTTHIQFVNSIQLKIKVEKIKIHEVKYKMGLGLKFNLNILPPFE